MPRKPPVRSDPPLDRGHLLAELREAGVPTSPEELARALGVKRRDQEAFAAALDDAVRAGESWSTARASSWSPRSSTSCVVASRGTRTASASSCPTPAARICSSARARCTRRCMATVSLRASSASTAAAGRKARSSRCSSAPTSRWSVACTRNTVSGSSWPRTGASARTSWSARTNAAGRSAGQVVVLELIAAAVEDSRSRSGASSRCWATMPTRAWRSRSRCASTSCRSSSPSPKAQAEALPGTCARRTARAARTCATCRWSPSTARRRATSTMPCIASARARASAWSSPSPTSRHYVRHGDALDHDAHERGNSVYFPRRVIPMLPEELSNGLCSLNPNVDRLCMVCDMDIAADGAIKRYRFYPGGDVLASRGSPTRACGSCARRSGRQQATPRRGRWCRSSTTSTRCTRCWPRRARSAAPSISRRSRRA